MAHSATKIDRSLPFDIRRVMAITKNPSCDVGHLVKNTQPGLYNVNLYCYARNSSSINSGGSWQIRGGFDDLINEYYRILAETSTYVNQSRTIDFWYHDEKISSGTAVYNGNVSYINLYTRDSYGNLWSGFTEFLSGVAEATDESLDTINKWTTYKPLNKGTKQVLSDLDFASGSTTTDIWNGLAITPSGLGSGGGYGYGIIYPYHYVYDRVNTLSESNYGRLTDFAGYNYNAIPEVDVVSMTNTDKLLRNYVSDTQLYEYGTVVIRMPETISSAYTNDMFPFGYIAKQRCSNNLTALTPVIVYSYQTSSGGSYYYGVAELNSGASSMHAWGPWASSALTTINGINYIDKKYYANIQIPSNISSAINIQAQVCLANTTFINNCGLLSSGVTTSISPTSSMARTQLLPLNNGYFTHVNIVNTTDTGTTTDHSDNFSLNYTHNGGDVLRLFSSYSTSNINSYFTINDYYEIVINDLSNEHNGCTLQYFFMRYEINGNMTSTASYSGNDWLGLFIGANTSIHRNTTLNVTMGDSSRYCIDSNTEGGIVNGILNNANLAYSYAVFIGNTYSWDHVSFESWVENGGMITYPGQVMRLAEISLIIMNSNGYFEVINIWNNYSGNSLYTGWPHSLNVE